MERSEFLHHLNLIKELIEKPNIRIILMHPPYDNKQQKIIDSICSECENIIGQIERTPPLKEKAKEIQRLIASHHDPYLKEDQIQYIVLGQQKPIIKD